MVLLLHPPFDWEDHRSAAWLVIEFERNTRDPGRAQDRDPDGSHLGSRLMEAFAAQLSGRLAVSADAEEYRVVLVFGTGDDPAV